VTDPWNRLEAAFPSQARKQDRHDQALLEVRGLRTAFHTEAGAWPAVDGVDLSVKRGEILGLVGESGSGKSVTGFSLLGLIDPPGEVVEGEVRFNGKDLRSLSEEQMRQLRGNRIAMIFQDPLMTLNPVLRIEEQMLESIQTHGPIPRSEALRRCVEALDMVGIPSPEKRLRNYPHEFSGGMRQRVAIAIAMLNKPDLIICDEPTTALDVTIQGQILYRMQQICREHGTALIWITHDLGVVAELADRVAVMYAGRIVETGPVNQVLDAPRHPYTRGLLESMPARTQPGERLPQIEGMAPSLAARPVGCAFRPRCPDAITRCAEQAPSLVQEGDRSHRCYAPIQLIPTHAA
jgi:peptide/nickel transport system ATP-binding protein